MTYALKPPACYMLLISYVLPEYLSFSGAASFSLIFLRDPAKDTLFFHCILLGDGDSTMFMMSPLVSSYFMPVYCFSWLTDHWSMVLV